MVDVGDGNRVTEFEYHSWQPIHFHVISKYGPYIGGHLGIFYFKLN